MIQTLQGEGGSLELLLSTLADLSNSRRRPGPVIGDVINNLTNVLNTLGDRDTELSNLIVQLQGFISGLAQDRTTIGNAIDGINNAGHVHRRAAHPDPAAAGEGHQGPHRSGRRC